MYRTSTPNISLNLMEFFFLLSYITICIQSTLFSSLAVTNSTFEHENANVFASFIGQDNTALMTLHPRTCKSFLFIPSMSNNVQLLAEFLLVSKSVLCVCVIC